MRYPLSFYPPALIKKLQIDLSILKMLKDTEVIEKKVRGDV